MIDAAGRKGRSNRCYSDFRLCNMLVWSLGLPAVFAAVSSFQSKPCMGMISSHVC